MVLPVLFHNNVEIGLKSYPQQTDPKVCPYVMWQIATCSGEAAASPILL
jgi:hypothetical protein